MTIDELERLSKAATPVPWTWSSVGVSGVFPCSDTDAAFDCRRNDAEFIATVRNHIDALLKIARAAKVICSRNDQDHNRNQIVLWEHMHDLSEALANLEGK